MASAHILITGAGGFIGSKVACAMAKELGACAISGVGRNPQPVRHPPLPNYQYIHCDLLDRKALGALPDKIDFLVHLAGDGRTFIPPHEYSQQILTNVVMTSNVADYAVKAKAGLVIFASSVYVYSGVRSIPFQEDSIVLPAENLGATKLAAESLLKARANAGQFKVLSLRIFTVYGPGSRRKQFIPQAIEKLTGSDEVAKFGPSEVKRDFVYIDDVVRAFVCGLKLERRDFSYDVFNVGSGIARSIKEVVRRLADILGTHKQISFDATGRPRHPADIDHQADISAARSALAWQPEISMDTGLKRTVESMNVLE